MITTLLLMKVIAVAHGVLGYLGVAFVLSPELQAEAIYKDRNWLVADVKKYLIFGMCLCLLLCAFSPWFKPFVTPFWAWLALGFHLLSSVLDVTTGRGRVWCWRCIATGVTVKAIAALALTYLASVYASAGNG
jgi:hypothetical protein